MTDYKALYEQQLEENKKLKEALYGSAVEEDEDGFAVSDWFHEHLDKHIKFHLTDPGGEYNYIDTETGEHVFGLGPGGTLDGAFEYVGELQDENKKLKKRLTSNTKLIMKLKKENKQFKDKVKYLENEVCRYSNAIEQEYVLKTDYDQLENDSLVSHCNHCNVCLSYDDFNISLDVGHRCCEMCFEEKKLKDRDNPDHPQYHQICGYCGEVELGIDEHIFIFEHDTKETITTCCECGQDKSVCKELKEEGYTRDQEDD
jgi:hypothetical protein